MKPDTTATSFDDVPALFSRGPASSRVYDELRAQIVSLRLPPGTRLLRQELADAFGVSQSPMREAIQRLEQIGLVASYRQSRTEVTLIDQVQLRQQHILRTGIECEVVNYLAAQSGAKDLGKASAILKMQRALVDDLDQVEMFRQLDDAFHRELFAAAEQAELHAFVVDRSSQMARLRSLDLPSSGKIQSVIQGHQQILEAIQSGDRNLASDCMRRHLSGSIERMPRIVEQHPHYFR
jgi:DNA-binding GntR family transcriptional regulator